MWLLLTLFAQTFSLPKQIHPMAAEPAPSGYWISGATAGRPMRMFHADIAGTREIILPSDTLFWTTDPQGLLLITNTGIRRHNAESSSNSFNLSRTHTPYFLPWISGPPKALAVFDRDRLLLISPNGQPRSFPLSSAQRGEDLPRLLSWNGQIYWSDHHGGYRVSAKGFETLQSPDLRNMELARLMGPEPTWLVHGGRSGDLDSFGWSLHENEGAVMAGQGIVTGCGRDIQASYERLWLSTIPASLGGQVWQALRGTTTFTLTILQRREKSWQRAGRPLAVTLKKAKDRTRPFLFSLRTDMNGDGLSDLIVADDKRGVRVYPSKPDGALVQGSRRIAKKVDALLLLSDHILLGTRGKEEFRFTARRGL